MHNPTVLIKGDSVYLFYRAQDLKGTSRTGLAISADGLHFENFLISVFYADYEAMKI